ncbi:MAG: hypothetical protein JW939_05255 [Candidatus Thermoplasmatota archaeon]|nr:hypothetical protein [Candidatus Thermoplasmatota archaeon]
MEKAIEALGSIDPSDSMEYLMKAVGSVLQSIDEDPEGALATEALLLVSKKEELTREYYMRPLDSDEIYNTLIRLHMARGETEMADRYRRCLDLRQARKWTIIGDSYALLGLSARAVKFLKRALFFGPSEDLVEEVQKAHDKAQRRMDRAGSEIGPLMAKMVKDPSDPKFVQKAVSHLIDLDRLEEANGILTDLPAGMHNDPDIQYRRGCILFGMDDFENARDVFSAVLEQTPNSTNAKRAFNLAEEMIRGIR